MDPSKFLFDIEAYKRRSEIEERYIVNRFRERRNQIEERYTPCVKRKYHAAANQGSSKSSASEEWNELKQYMEKEFERLDKIIMRQEETNQAKKMEMFMKLSSKEHLDDRCKEMLEKLGRDLFGN
ncbi:unnamed protein product [Trifolium pratense]|uniref:Uncharacterized protein n=1 Tax=Trifolium pratense TaxID=57577 RepID=A0ACB0MDP8_TRIPR|nr:unnamed protein product [Trifolium pratense]